MIRLRPSGADEVLIKRVQDWYEPGPGVFIEPQSLFSPAMLFTGSTTGAWYDPSDFTTLFKDAAGTLPVTAVEQPVGRMLDKSGKGNHAFNSSGNSANFPVLSARYNGLLTTENLTGASWVLGGAASRTATTFTATSDSDFLYQTAGAFFGSMAPGIGLTASVELSGTGTIKFAILDGGGNDIGAQQITLTSTPTRYSISASNNVTGVSIGVTFGGTGALVSANLSKVDFRVSNDALNQPAYQRVNTSTDYDTVGFKPYLRFNGVSQWLQTNSIDFTYGDKMFVCAGFRKIGTSISLPVELSADADTTAGTFNIGAPVAADLYYASLHGSFDVSAKQTPATFPSPITSVVQVSYALSQPSATDMSMRVNAVSQTLSVASGKPGPAGAGNYGNYPLYIGARAGSLAWFNGRLYGMVVAGKQASASEISSTETYLNQKTGAY